MTSETREIPAITAATAPRNGRGQLAPTEEVAERDALILRLLVQGRTYSQIVDMHLPGIANKGAVSKARRRALDAIRAPAMAEYRAEQLAKLDALEAGAWDDVRNPGPKTSVTGKVVTDEQGEPLPDKAVRDAARNTILKTVRTRMDLLGLAAPRKSMSLQATMELDSENESLQAQLAEAYGTALAEKDQELAELRTQLAEAQDPGPPALTVLIGKAERPLRTFLAGIEVTDDVGVLSGHVSGTLPERSRRTVPGMNAGDPAAAPGTSRPLRAARRFRLASPATALVTGAVVLALMAAEFPLSGFAHLGMDQTGGAAIWFSAPFVLIGFILAWRKPGNPLGWISLGIGGTGAISEVASFYVVACYGLRHGSLPFGWVALLAQPTWSVSVVLLGLAFLLFPDGQLPSPRLRWLLWVFLTAGAVWMAGAFTFTISAITRHDIHIDRYGNLQVLSQPSGSAAWWGVLQGLVLVTVAVSALVSLAAQVASYRRSSGERRQQLKWLLGGSVVTVAGLLVAMLGSRPGLAGVIGHLSQVLAAFAVPVSMGVAILKYRLYDIDRIVSRTLSYAIVTGLLVGVYAALVLLATRVMSVSSPVAVAASTLAAAALFTPVRRRVQRVVDRRFNRVRYDADQTVMAFAARLKDPVDLDSVRDDLAQVVSGALEPAHLSVWTVTATETGSETPGRPTSRQAAEPSLPAG